MEKSAIRMIAKMVSVNKIEVQLIRRYYEGNCPRFYLRDLNNNTLIEIEISAKFVEEEYVHYYFDNVEIDFCHVYQIVDAYGLAETLQYTQLIYDAEFLKNNYYDGNDLGNSYHEDYTIFKVWAPTALAVKVAITKDHTTYSYEMKRIGNGVFCSYVAGNFDNCEYVYLVRHHDSYIKALDPYAYGSSSMVKVVILLI